MSSSIRRTDILALSGLRNDGRKHHEVRRLRIQLGPLGAGQCNGSVLIVMGHTVALASVRGPIECTRRSDELRDSAVVDVQNSRLQHIDGPKIDKSAHRSTLTGGAAPTAEIYGSEDYVETLPTERVRDCRRHPG